MKETKETKTERKRKKKNKEWIRIWRKLCDKKRKKKPTQSSFMKGKGLNEKKSYLTKDAIAMMTRASKEALLLE